MYSIDHELNKNLIFVSALNLTMTSEIGIIIICIDGGGNWGTEKLTYLVSQNAGIPSQVVWLRAYCVNHLKLLPSTSVTHCTV